LAGWTTSATPGPGDHFSTRNSTSPYGSNSAGEGLPSCIACRESWITRAIAQDIQVRSQSARATLAVAPAEARRAIEAIAASRQYPQAGDAGMTLINLDRGIFVPD